MKISVVGTIMRDEVVTPGWRREGFGGILYNVMTLASMMRRADEIMPICSVGQHDLQILHQRYFMSHHQVSTRGIRVSPMGTDRCLLEYDEGMRRSETHLINSAPLSGEQVLLAADSRATIVNFVGGHELTLDVMRLLRSHSLGLIHLDLHNLGRNQGDAPATPDWRQWFALADTVQMNEWEAQAITGSELRTEADYLSALMEVISVPTIRVAIITLAEKGAFLAHRMKTEKRVFIVRYQALPLEEALDPTGCGDCFASAFTLEMLRSGNPARAGLLAAALSGLNAMGGGVEDLLTRTGSVEAVAQHFFPSLFARIHNGWTGDPVPLSVRPG